MDLGDLLAPEAAEEEENTALEELDEEIVLFDIQEALPSPSSDHEDSAEEAEVEKQIAVAPCGIALFRNKKYSLYTEDTLLWPPQHYKLDPFLSVIDPSIVKECIKNGYFVREISAPNVLIKYLFHTMCCTSDEDLLYSSCKSLMYILTTCKSVSFIKSELYLALANLGADLSLLQRDVLNYRSHVIPPPSYTGYKGVRMTDTRLREILSMVLRFLSQCFARHKNYTSQDADEFILIFIAVALDPKIIDAVLDAYISACIANTLILYSTNEIFVKSLRNLVKRVIEYCSSDLPSVLYVCQACITPTDRGKILRSAIAFQQLTIHLKLPNEDLVDDVQVKHVADLLTRYFEIYSNLTEAYDSYYAIELIDMCLHLDLIQPQQKDDLKIICDLVEQKFRRSQGSADDMNPTISFQYLAATLSKWKRYLSSLHEPQPESSTAAS